MKKIVLISVVVMLVVFVIVFKFVGDNVEF